MNEEPPRPAEAIDSNMLIVCGGVFKSYERDEYIFREGDHPQFYHQIIAGKVKMVSETDKGREFIQGFYTDGQSFGEPLIFDSARYQASAIAEHSSIIIRLCVASFLKLLKENFFIHLNLTVLLSHRLEIRTNALKEVSCHTPEHRIVSMLDHYKNQNQHDPATGKIKIDYTRQQIAAMTGLRVETVIRVMRHLYERNILNIEKGKVYY